MIEKAGLPGALAANLRKSHKRWKPAMLPAAIKQAFAVKGKGGIHSFKWLETTLDSWSHLDEPPKEEPWAEYDDDLKMKAPSYYKTAVRHIYDALPQDPAYSLTAVVAKGGRR